MIMSERFYVACWRNDSPSPYRYWGDITTSLAKAEGWLAEAQMSFPEEDWGIYSFYD